MLKLFVGDPKRGRLAVARAAALIIHRIITIITITVSHPLSLSHSLSLFLSLSFSFPPVLHLAKAHKEYIHGLAPRQPPNDQAIYTFHTRVLSPCEIRVFVKRRSLALARSW